MGIRIASHTHTHLLSFFHPSPSACVCMCCYVCIIVCSALSLLGGYIHSSLTTSPTSPSSSTSSSSSSSLSRMFFTEHEQQQQNHDLQTLQHQQSSTSSRSSRNDPPEPTNNPVRDIQRSPIFIPLSCLNIQNAPIQPSKCTPLNSPTGWIPSLGRGKMSIHASNPFSCTLVAASHRPSKVY